VLLETLEELSKRNIPGEILTTPYQNITTPPARRNVFGFYYKN
jgi:HKD family nuclease